MAKKEGRIEVARRGFYWIESTCRLEAPGLGRNPWATSFATGIRPIDKERPNMFAPASRAEIGGIAARQGGWIFAAFFETRAARGVQDTKLEAREI
jgi:hypothetical protein